MRRKETSSVCEPEIVQPQAIEDIPVCPVVDKKVPDNYQEVPPQGTCSIWTSTLDEQQDFNGVLASECESEFKRLK